MTRHRVQYTGLCFPDYPKVKNDCGFLYFKRQLCCFENSSTPIAVTVRCLFSDLIKPMLAELGAKKDIYKKTRGAKQAHKQAQ